jgi:CheY-like chemotaxis protein
VKEAAHVLLVDDNFAKRGALKAVLAPLGLPVVEAESGLGALRCVMPQDFAVVLFDVRMSTMDGFETRPHPTTEAVRDDSDHLRHGFRHRGQAMGPMVSAGSTSAHGAGTTI